MALREEMERSGSWLFRWRSYLPVVLLLPVIAALVWPPAWLAPGWRSGVWGGFCLAVSMAGQAVRVWAVGHAPSGTSGRNTRDQIADDLNTTGIYSTVRHPLYVGNYLMWIGLALFPGDLWVALVVTLVFWLYYERIMVAEEAFLRGRFGPAFESWSARTPGFIPSFRGYVPPDLPFSLRTVLRREYSGFTAVTTLFALFVTLADLFAGRGLRWHSFWYGLLIFGLLVYVVLRTLKRRTRVLHVSGR